MYVHASKCKCLRLLDRCHNMKINLYILSSQPFIQCKYVLGIYITSLHWYSFIIDVVVAEDAVLLYEV